MDIIEVPTSTIVNRFALAAPDYWVASCLRLRRTLNSMSIALMFEADRQILDGDLERLDFWSNVLGRVTICAWFVLIVALLAKAARLFREVPVMPTT